MDPTWLFVSLIPSGIGFAVLVYGKKQQSWPHLIAGLALLVYPYFTESVTALVGVGVAVLAALWLAIRLGW
jgi:branched-subunit amino acid transport protein